MSRISFIAASGSLPAAEVALIIAQHGAGLITLNEARAKLALGPVAGGDELAVSAPEPMPEEVPAGA